MRAWRRNGPSHSPAATQHAEMPEAMAARPPRPRRIALDGPHPTGMKMTALAAELGLSVARVSQLIKKYEDLKFKA